MLILLEVTLETRHRILFLAQISKSPLTFCVKIVISVTIY